MIERNDADAGAASSTDKAHGLGSLVPPVQCAPLAPARDVVDGELASYISSHGGVITVDSAEDGVLTLDFGGACTDCPAAGSTLHERIETAVRGRYPGLASVARTREDRKPRGWLGWPGRGSR